MRQSEPALHEPEEPLEIVAEDQKVILAVPAVAILPNLRTAKARPVIATAGVAKAAR
jgi:hypothetical protein